MRTRYPVPLLATLAALVAGLLVAGTAMAATTTLTATLANAGSGDSDGSGSAEVTIDTDSGEVCWELTVANIEPAVASHIHVGAAGTDGGVVVPLDVDGFTGSSTGCGTPADADLDAIVANPAGFYVNIHTADYPAGAIRGQLAASGTPNTALPRPDGSPLTLVGMLLAALGGVLLLRLAFRRA
ncbi:MAG: CHRD domain-containing protein [Candidatus Limnocylindria bacterium]